MIRAYSDTELLGLLVFGLLETLAIISCCNYQFFASHKVSLLDSVFMSLIATVSLAAYALVTVAVAIVAGSIILACVKYFI